MSSQLLVSEESRTRSTVPGKRKRTKYVAKACNECKRRKIKCGGQQPCDRCWRFSVRCEYQADNHHNNTTSVNRNVKKLLQQVQSLQSQVDLLSARTPQAPSRSTGSSSFDLRLNGSHHDCGSDCGGGHDDTQSHNQGHGQTPLTRKISFRGLTTSSIDFGIARQSLRDRGITDLERPGDVTQEPTPLPSPSLSLSLSSTRDGFLQSLEPFWTVSREETLRLCRVYDEEMGRMYPVVDMGATVSLVHALYNHLGSFPFSGAALPAPPPPFTNEDVTVLNMVFACALTAEGNGHDELALRIFRRVREPLAEAIWQPPAIHTATILTLVCTFLFQTDEEALAWRTVGMVQRMCMEMGLHRAETYSQPSILAIGREKVIRLFWSVYTLEVRFSMGTGMPNHLHFGDIDPSLPRPSDEPYLDTMIDYCRIYQRVWRFVTGPSSGYCSTRAEEMAYLDWQVMQWYLHIPEQLKLPSLESVTRSSINKANRSVWRLKTLLYLRNNMMRILLHRPILLKAENITKHPKESSTVVDIAKSSIRLITQLNQVSDIYSLQQVAFNWFLVSALAVLVLAVAQAPAQFTSSCRDEFYMALELVEGFSMKSYVSRRLWKSIRSLRTLAPQMGMGLRRQNQNRPQGKSQTSAPQEVVPLTTTDPATTTIDCVSASPVMDARELEDIPAVPNVPDDNGSQDDQHVDGTQMSRDLMDLYMAMGEPADAEDPSNQFGSEQLSLMDSFWFGNEAELAEIFKDCF